ncbi:MAG TPA: hypothetical protein VEL76_32410 [Gemmataceae bacterium]|nr:hypothetical protein [Gemmataceae bacterium]
MLIGMVGSLLALPFCRCFGRHFLAEYTSLEELPYVMGLVRQSFETQMGNSGEA